MLANPHRAPCTFLILCLLSAHTVFLDPSVVAFGAPTEDQSVQPRTWHVANNGVDESICGGQRSPCRSISQAIANASAGDSILVGPGRYGDLNEDSALGGVGEEAGGCGAVICVRKAVRLLSREGAERTVIDATGVTPQTNGVTVRADDVVFGLPDRGFTVRGAHNIGVLVQSARVRIVDNIATANRSAGFGLLGAVPVGCKLIGNTALGNDLGFVVFGDNNRLELNVAQSNTSSGFWLRGNGHHLHHNIAIGNRDGAVIGVGGSNHLIVRNAFIGNGSHGVNVLQQVTGLIVRKNNIFGNGTRISSSANRGLSNSSGALVLATNNFWGSDTGPGPDPADDIFTNRLSETRFLPFAVKPFEIRSGDDKH